jgi:mRNA interferase RelE/StbE
MGSDTIKEYTDLAKHSCFGVSRSVVAQALADPAAQVNNVKKLTGINACRLRVGGFRVIFSETAETIAVLDIGPRGDIYD